MSFLDRGWHFRKFDPLFKPLDNNIDLIYHLCVYLEENTNNNNTKMGTDCNDVKNERNFESLKNNINHFNTISISVKSDFLMKLVISVNGHISNENYIEYLKNLHNTVIGKNNNIHVIVFQRQNIGFQWGGLHDVWLRYNNTNCDWYVTSEQDVKILKENWFDDFLKKFKLLEKNIGYIGMADRINTINPYGKDKLISKEVWKDKNGKVINATTIDTQHTRGGFYFCKKSFLQDMDNHYGCFTHSLGNNYYYDGVVLGEVGFGQKTLSLGYDLYRYPESIWEVDV